MKTKREAANVREMVAKAWAFCWAEKLVEAAEAAKAREAGRPWFNEAATAYLTASDLVSRVRCHAEEILSGKAYGENGSRGWSHGVRISTGGRPLLDVVRGWLFDEVAAGRLRCDNSKRTSTRARFRPVGVELAAAEIESKAKREAAAARGTVRHMSTYNADGSKRYGVGRCVAERRDARRAAAKAKGYGLYMPGRAKIGFTVDEASAVTCAHCLAILKREAAAAGGASEVEG